MSDNNEVEENANVPAETNNSSTTNKSSNVSKGIQKKVQERLSKSLKKNVAKQSLMKVLMPILIYAIAFIMILIIIIGIILFLITMPGMVMDQLKAFARQVGDAVSSWFGSDSTTQVNDEDVYETLDYLEQMGYDLKGYGFLTDYVGEDDDGVERDEENDTISEAESDFIVTYLVSDNYVYTIKNFNLVADNALIGLGQHIASLFTGGESNKHWSRGMLEIYLDGGNLGAEAEYYDVYKLGYVKSDPESKTLEIKRGWFNNSIKYNLDGWTGRYGMPIDFLLSVHLATMMPDLSYDMATSFNTIIKLLLHPVGGGEQDENTAIGYYKIGDKYIAYDEFADAATSGFTGSLNTWRISKKEAMVLFEKYPELKSPENCTGTANVGEDPIVPEDEEGYEEHSVDFALTVDANGDDIYNEYLYTSSPEYLNNEDGKAKKDQLVEYYNEMINTFKEYGFKAEDATNAGMAESISSIDGFKAMLEDQPEMEDEDQGNGIVHTYEYREPTKKLSKTIVWESTDPKFDTYTAEIELTYDNYDYVVVDENIPEGSVGRETISPMNGAKVKYKIVGDWTEERIQEWLDEKEIEVPEEARCSNLVGEEDECCSACRKYLQNIYDYIKKADVSDLEIYQPYISRVVDHWYRDVYFVSDKEKQFVTYDYEYESIMKERWTLYETYEDGDLEGEYKLYKVNEDGSLGDLYGGTQEEAQEAGIPVSKKAVTEEISSMAEDLQWHETANDKLAAYEVEDISIEDFQAVYPDVTEEDDDYEIKKNVYVKLITTGNIVQTGEGQRTETNPLIKKMFLQNEYLRYDGSAETAEIIKELRKQINGEEEENYYGPVKGERAITVESSEEEGKIEKEFEEVDYTDVSVEIDGEEHKISEYSGTVNLNQDSLNAFSMLENTHTLDADYIYRDFKELIVELGFFEKEELTDEAPRLLQWLIPDIGSYGYPTREIDKNEHEFGTMIHSKGDTEANIKNTLTAAIQMASAEESTEELESGQTSSTDTTNGISVEEQNFDNIVSGLNLESSTEFTSLGSVSESSTSLLSIDEWWESQQEMFDVFQSEGWTYALDHSCSTFDIARTSGKHTTDCSLMASWALQRLGALDEGLTFSSALGESGSLSGGAVADSLLDAGAEVIVPAAGTKFSSAASSGELEPGDVLFYSGHVSIYCGPEYEKGGETYCWDTGSTSGIQAGGPRDTSWESRDIKLIVRFPLGTGGGQTGEAYSGYEGNEAVVSPVTGILLDYGTYEDEVDSVTGEEYRVNVDLKYGTGLMSNTNSETEDTQQTQEQTQTETEGETQIDKVGYAKILVLDKENYKKLETALISSTQFEDSFLASNGNYREIDDLTEETVNEGNGDYDPWTDIDKTLYGYKEFARIYEEFGIAGNIIYIDGFKCELPDEEFDIKAQGETESPSGEEITMSTFEGITTSIFDGSGNISEDAEILDSLYETDDISKMASKKATEKLNAEAQVKTDAISSLYVNGLRVIKEGTVIGRTITDRELIVDYRGKTYEDYRGGATVTTEDENGATTTIENGDKVIGNYIRIIMSDINKDIVENVEDYMKLDGETEGTSQQADHFSVIGTVLSKEEWVEKALAYTANHGDSTFKNRANLEELYDICEEKGINPEFIFVRGIQECGLSAANGNNYWGYNTPNGSGLWDGGTWQHVLELYCDTILEYQDPASSYYQTIMERYEERKACTENGGIDPYGYGLPSSVSGLQCLYSWLGDDHSANDAGGGGMYYLYPWGWGGNQYEGENKIIFESKEEFESLCGSKHGTSGGATSSTPTTVWEQGMYTAWQSKKIIDPAKEIFGELAGTHDP